MNAKTLRLGKSPLAVCLLTAQLLTFSTNVFAAKSSGGGVIGGGGGDASEARVNEIRADILNWINIDGAVNLDFKNSITYEDYRSRMTDILRPQEVVIGFVEKDHPTNNELQVSVKGVPKTCRGFISKIDYKAHILCNIDRFKNTSDQEQYRLIHHEYAGLAGVEYNKGAASDYQISSQITDFLETSVVLKLAVKKNPKLDLNKVREAMKAQMVIARKTYRNFICDTGGIAPSFKYVLDDKRTYIDIGKQLDLMTSVIEVPSYHGLDSSKDSIIFSYVTADPDKVKVVLIFNFKNSNLVDIEVQELDRIMVNVGRPAEPRFEESYDSSNTGTHAANCEYR